MKNPSVLAFPLLLLVGLFLIIFAKNPAPAQPASYKDTTFSIDGAPVKLTDPGIAYFGNDATGDLNGDGQTDTAFIFTNSPGGSGTFYYVVVALATSTGYQGTNAVLLGDRIAPQTTQIEYGELVVNYADRAATEPMTAQPSIGISKYLVVKNGVLAEIPANEYAAANLLLGTDSSAKLGTYLIGSSGMTLYNYSADPVGSSNCLGACAENWPPYIVPGLEALANIQAHIDGTVSAITRADGTLQVAYNGSPLYYYVGDKNAGDIRGANVSTAWKIAKP